MQQAQGYKEGGQGWSATQIDGIWVRGIWVGGDLHAASAPRAWHMRLKAELEALGFCASDSGRPILRSL
jgi:hypothetical protein